MALLMYQQQRLINRLSPCMKCTALVQTYSKKVERGGLDPNVETPYFSMRDVKRFEIITTDVLALLQRNTLTWKEIKLKFKWNKERKMREDQRFLPERLKILGPDLALAHFITFRGGKVKFKNQDSWKTCDDITSKEIPSKFAPNMYIEAVDASGTKLCYEGFDNFINLYHLKELLLRNCPYIDDWCLHRLSAFESSLEHLDISGCHDVTERGICTLHNLKNLKTLVLNDTPMINDKELTCLLLQDILPQCNIIGVDYSDPSLWKRLKEHLT